MQRLGLWSDRVRARWCRLTHESRLMATSGRLLPGSLGRLSSHDCASVGTRDHGIGPGSLVRPRVAATTLLPSADFCAPIGLPLGSPSTRQARRSPRVRRVTFLPYPPHIHRAVPDDRGLRTPTLPRPTARCLTCDSCASGQNFAFSFLQIPPHDGHPCCSARSSCHQGLQGTCTLKSLPGRLSPSG